MKKRAHIRGKFAEAAKKSHPVKKAAERPCKVAVVKLHGSIASDSDEDEGGKTICWDDFEPVIAQAFAWKGAKAVVLDIDSPGGSAAEAEMIGREIRFQANRHKKPVYAFVRGAANSGGYWIACAADKIYALQSSDVGSVGVITAGFGYTRMNKKKGIDRRVFTAGERKSQMDAHLPLRREDVRKTKEDLNDLFTVFKGWVLERRGSAFKGKPADILNGDSWYAERALKLGLIDGIGFVKDVVPKLLGKKEIQYGLFEPQKKGSVLEDFIEAALAGMAAKKESANRVERGPRILALDDRPRPKF